METNDADRGGGCLSEGSEPVVDPRITKLCFDDSGNASLNARRLLDGKYGDKNKIEVIRPGHFVPGPIRDTGLKRPLLIKGDRYNFNPQMGVALLDTGLTAAELEDRMDTEKQVETWDVGRQRPGPQWKLGQFTTYWHARKEYVAQQALQGAKQQTVAAGRFGEDPVADEEDLEDDGDSGQLIVLQRPGGLPHAAMRVAPQVGIAPEQAMKLYCGEYLPMDAPQRPQLDPGSVPKPLTDEIHPPPTILSLDLVRLLERHLGRDCKAADAAHDQRANEPSSSGAKGNDRVSEQRGSQAGDKGSEQQLPEVVMEKPKVAGGRHAGVPAIGPTKTIHLQMTPVGCFTDFRAAPGGAATWLYVLTGRKVLALLPPTARNRSLYMAWAQASLAQTANSQVLDVFLADYAEDALRVEVKQNEALLIPSGWFYASVATQDCIAVCCFFWHPYALGDVARTQHLQQHLRQRDTDLCRRARQLMWCAALHYARNLRERMGLPVFRASRPGGSARTTPSNSQSSGLQQPMRSPRSRMLGTANSAGGAAAASGSLGGSGRKTPRGTPPLVGFAALQQQFAGDNMLLSSAQSPSAQRGIKRSRDGMDALLLPESAIPLSGTAAAAAAAAAAAGGAKTPRATSSAAAAAAVHAPTGHKKLKISTFSAGGGPVTPRSVSKGGSIQQPQQQHSGDTHSTGAAGGQQRVPQQQTSSGTPRLRLKGSTPRHSQQQRQRDRQRWSYMSDAVVEDDEEGDCQTSPVRQPPAVADYLDMFDAQHTSEAAAPVLSAAAGGYGGQQQDGGRVYMQVDMSPIVGGIRGDLDLVPLLNMGAAALQQPPGASPGPGAAAAAAAGCLPPLGLAPVQHQAAGVAAGTAAAAGGGGACGGASTPRMRIKLKTSAKTPSTSTAAGAAAPSTSVATGAAGPGSAAAPAPVAAASYGGAAAGLEATGGSSSPHAKSGDTAGAQAATGVSRRSTPEESCCRNSSQQQGSGSNEASQQQPQQFGTGSQQQQQVWQQQRRVSDSANSRPLQPPAAPTAAVGARSSAVKIRLKRPTPSPQLAPSAATAAAEAAVPPLQLGQALTPPQLQQQAVPVAAQVLALDGQQQPPPQQHVPSVPVSSIPQLDGAVDMVWRQPPAAAAGAQADDGLTSLHHHRNVAAQQQQQQCFLWARWQQLQAGHHHQQRQLQPQAMQPGWQQHGSAGAAPAAAGGERRGIIPQCDGAGDDGRPHDTHGPMLVLQPAPACNGDMQQQQFKAAQQQQQQQGQAQKPLQRLEQGVGPRNGATQGHDGLLAPSGQVPAASKAVILKNPAVQSSMQLHMGQTNQRKPLAAAAAASGSNQWSLSPPRAAAAATAGSPFEGMAAGQPAGPSNRQSADGAACPQAVAVDAVVAAAPAAVAHDTDVAMLGAPLQQAAAVAGGVLGGCISREGSSLPSAAAELAAVAAAAVGASTGSRSSSPTNQQAAAAAAAAAVPVTQLRPAGAPAQPQQYQQQQQAMLPPLPVKVSSWEVTELPVLLQYLQEQVATGLYGGLDAADLPAGVTDPGYLLEQLEEAVAKAAEQEQHELAAAAARQDAPSAAPAAAGGAQQQQPAPAAAAAAHGRGPQLQRPRSLRELCDDASAWQALCGDLHPEPLQPDTMRLAVEFTTALQQGFEVQRTLGWGEEQKMHADTTDAVVAETDPAPTNSYQSKSAGSYHSGAGTARGAREAAAGRGYQPAVRWPRTAGGAGGRGAAGGAGGGAAAAGPGMPANRPAATRGEQQAREAKRSTVLKNIGLGGRAGKR